MVKISASGLTKYNITGDLPELPAHERKILVVGQVEDDASIQYGAGDIRTNLDLLRAARRENPDACLLWKPHPDVEAGLRNGHVTDAELEGLADYALLNASAHQAIDACDEVWTITSTLGFEALLRGMGFCSNLHFE